ncbi:MAG: hypothetical protein D6812_00730 [Deltaproteobacteria bacterium]|nr:MAG: hypothetical protein D6812_00730 [Deltaproteobacteria bacterium]
MPTSIIANICMGMMYKKQRKNKEAISYYQKILEIRPRHRFALLEIREIQTGKRDAEREKALGDFLNRRNK